MGRKKNPNIIIRYVNKDGSIERYRPIDNEPYFQLIEIIPPPQQENNIDSTNVINSNQDSVNEVVNYGVFDNATFETKTLEFEIPAKEEIYEYYEKIIELIYPDEPQSIVFHY